MHYGRPGDREYLSTIHEGAETWLEQTVGLGSRDEVFGKHM